MMIDSINTERQCPTNEKLIRYSLKHQVKFSMSRLLHEYDLHVRNIDIKQQLRANRRLKLLEAGYNRKSYFPC